MAFVKKKGVVIKVFKKLPLKQMLKIIKSHLIANICIFILEMLMIEAVHATKAGGCFFSVFALLVYFVVLFSDAYNIAEQDKKSYTAEEPYFCKGFLLAIGLTVVTAILYLVYYYVWHGYSTTNVGFLLNMVFRIWVSAFRTFIGLENAFMQWYGYIVVIVVPIIFSGIGYIAGLKGFDLHSKLLKFVYENKEEKENNGQNK